MHQNAWGDQRHIQSWEEESLEARLRRQAGDKGGGGGRGGGGGWSWGQAVQMIKATNQWWSLMAALCERIHDRN